MQFFVTVCNARVNEKIEGFSLIAENWSEFYKSKPYSTLATVLINYSDYTSCVILTWFFDHHRDLLHSNE